MHGRPKIAAGSSSGSNSKAAAAATAAADRAGTRRQGEGLMTLGICKAEAAAQQLQGSSNCKNKNHRHFSYTPTSPALSGFT